MNECSSDHGVTPQVSCILTYGGSASDIAINYSILLLNLTACATVLQEDDTISKQTAVVSLAFVVEFQIILCLIVGCSGISIIWCACAGWMIRKLLYTQRTANLSSDSATTQAEPGSPMNCFLCQKITLCADAVAIFYYMLVTEPITTVAHVCAIALGMLLHRSSERSSLSTDATTEHLLQRRVGSRV
jgi:hypothetical protein